MQFVITGTDRDNGFERRANTRADHLEYWQGLGDIFLAAGPFLNEDEAPVGSMIIVEADSLAQAQAFAQNDPYVLQQVFKSHTVRRWNWLFGKPEKD